MLAVDMESSEARTALRPRGASQETFPASNSSFALIIRGKYPHLRCP